MGVLTSWWRRQASGAVGVKASPELLWLCGARRELCRAAAEPQGLATHLHVSFCLLEDTDCPCTLWVEPRLCWPPPRALLPSLEPVCVCPPNRPQPRPLWLQELALPCNVLILIKVQTGFFGGGGGAQVWDEKGTALPHPYCMPPHSFFFSHLQLKTMHFTDITHTYLTGAGHPASALGKDSQRTTKMSFLRQRLKPSELGLRARMPKPLLFIKTPLPRQPLCSPVYLL